MLQNLVVKKAAEIAEKIVEIRRELHKCPEKSGSEYKTKEILLNALSDTGLEIKTGYYNTGFAVTIRGSHPGPTVGLRFDMDALEMDELIEKPFKSQNQGLMHACGHDGHMAMGIGCALVLNDLKDHLSGNIKLIFQPAEEDARSGGGAQYMIRDGVLSDEPKVEAMVGMHIWPELKVGQAGTRIGPLMAASDPFKIVITGKGGHASMPYKCVDPILIASHLVVAIQSIISRNTDPFEPAVVTIGILNAGTRYNTIPETAEIYGTVRTFDEETRQLIKRRLETLSVSVAESYGGVAEATYTLGYPSVMNDTEMVNIASKSITKVLGDSGFVDISRPAPGGEDFAYFSQVVPSVFIWLGYNEENNEVAAPHNPYYDFDESILEKGVKIMCQTAIDWLEKNK